MESVRIVLVDDHQIVRDGLKELLEKTPGFTVVASENTAKDGLRAILDVRPDIAIVDLSLPDESGIWVVENVRKEQETPILVLSMIKEQHMVVKALEVGANGYLTKSVDPPTLVQAVHSLTAGQDFLEPQITTAVLQAMRQRTVESELNFSDREREILLAMSEGRSNPEIGKVMHISLSTVKAHVRLIFHKLEVTSRTEAVVKGIELGLVAGNKATGR